MDETGCWSRLMGNCACWTRTMHSKAWTTVLPQLLLHTREEKVLDLVGHMTLPAPHAPIYSPPFPSPAHSSLAMIAIISHDSHHHPSHTLPPTKRGKIGLHQLPIIIYIRPFAGATYKLYVTLALFRQIFNSVSIYWWWSERWGLENCIG